MLLLFCCDSKQDKKNYIARVDKTVLTAEELSLMLPKTDKVTISKRDYINSLVTTWIKKEILYNKAKEFHFDKDKSLKQKVKNYHRDLTTDSYIKYFIQTNITITEKEIRNYYIQNRKSFTRDNEEAKVSHIVVQDFAEAKQIKSILLSRNRKALDKLFSTYSFETKIVRRGDSIKEVDKTIFEMSPRFILGPIASDYGYHVIEVLARYKNGSARRIDEVRDEIINRLTQNKIQQNYNHLIDSLSSVEDYEINEENLSKFISNL